MKKSVRELKMAGTYPSRSLDAARRLDALPLTDAFDGVIGQHLVEEAIQGANGQAALDQLMLDLLPVAQRYSVATTSGFKVGAVCEGVSGNLYLGANLELPGLPLGFTVHAEQSAISNAFAHGEKAVRGLGVTNPPCGHCRQFLTELATASTLEIMIAGSLKTSLSDLLPKSFGPGDLDVQGSLLDHPETPLLPLAATADPLVAAALGAATRSYAPYTRSYSGVALRLKNTLTISGAYLENAAYNPSVPPILTAIDRLRFSRAQPADISEAVLVELEHPKISQQAITRLVVDTVAKGAVLRVVIARLANE